MKYLVASDIHGSLFFLNKLLSKINEEKVDKVILLGDLYYHGPRNALPIGYNPKEVASKLNEIKDKLLVVRGNCDALVDEMISDFKFNDYIELNINNKSFYFTHGHIINIDNPIKNKDVIVYGHFHTGFIKTKDSVIYINPGSVSLPKNNTLNSYVIIEEEKETINVYLKELEGYLIDKYFIR